MLVTEGVLQLSVAVGIVQMTVAAASAESNVATEILLGQLVKTGFIVSIAHGLVTVMVKEHVALLFLASVAV